MAKRVYERWLGLSGGRAVRMIAIGLSGGVGYGNVLRTLWAGGTVVLFDARDPIPPMYRHGVTHIVAPTLALQSMLAHMPPDAQPPPARPPPVQASARHDVGHRRSVPGPGHHGHFLVSCHWSRSRPAFG
jgi:hypothetical protein